MTWNDYTLVGLAVFCWAVFLLGLDDVPGWQGFGRGLVVGSTGSLVVHMTAKLWRRWTTDGTPPSN